MTMNKLVALGMAALGASSIQVVSAQPLSAPPQKPWNVSATLRGFYDDNVNTATVSANQVDTFGVEISPAIGFSWMNDATTVKLGYRYSLKYYDEKPDPNQDRNYNNTHLFDATIDHAFSDRYRISLSDAFAIGQEPDVIRDPGAPGQVVDGNNVRNFANVVFNGQLTPVFGIEAGYGNSWFDYEDELVGFEPPPSSSGSLDRVENRVYFEGQWRMMPQTTGILGYQLGMINYTGDEDIGFGFVSDDRNNYSHYLYAGVDHKFRPDFSASLRGGVQIIDFYNAPSGSAMEDTEASPYVQAALNYTYAPESYLRGGFTQSRTATYNTTAADADTSVLFASLYHRIIPRLYGSVMSTFQYSVFNGGPTDGNSDTYFTAGLNLMYRLNTYLSTEVGYNFDTWESNDANIGYNRNRVYIGITASY
jgi:hypothetical protein